jgi:hypothetical protein
MAKIQIREILPVEAQMEDLSDDVTSRIQGEGVVEDILNAVGEFLSGLDEGVREFLSQLSPDQLDDVL